MDTSKFFLNLVYICFMLLCATAQELVSHCPDVFVYQSRSDSDGRWYGLMNLASKQEINRVQIKLKLDRPALNLGNIFGIPNTYDNKEYTITNNYINLNPSNPRLLGFYINYDASQPKPKLVSIEQNGRIICSPPAGELQGPTSTTSRPTTARIVSETQCGITEVISHYSLDTNKKEKVEAKYPWYAAIYRMILSESRYSCGGTLISKQYVLTAANCVTHKTGNALPSASITVQLGRGSLSQISPDIQTHDVAELIVHSNYDAQTFSNNLAVLKLKEPARYNKFVRPICLWQGSSDSEGMVGQTGTVIGWSYNEQNEPTEDQAVIKMPLISVSSCRSDPFYANYVDTNTYCAGFSSGSSVCNVDSGAGMFFERNGVHQLLGIVSLAKRTEAGDCDPKQFVVFINAAKYDYLKQYI